eukprot:FR735482.1.p3 GENE.FR735482.1~~FR735482.1.p3  ORF type:complete len:118 (+),score=20.60 FR735482.1:231-584(+)
MDLKDGGAGSSGKAKGMGFSFAKTVVTTTKKKNEGVVVSGNDSGTWAQLADPTIGGPGGMEWFCDVCTGTIDNEEVRYDSTVEHDWCCCPDCYDSGAYEKQHTHPVVPQTGPCPAAQ